jgi:pimeloyl-ACP methyl ester carboxylesterase
VEFPQAQTLIISLKRIIVTPEKACSFFVRPRRNTADAADFDTFVPGATPFTFQHRGNTMRGRIVGDGDKTVLLVHGWESRAAHLLGFLLDLRHAGFRVAAFDAPAHGDSEGEKGHVGEMGRAVLEAQTVLGRIDAVVAHSAGSPAALYAMSQGLKVAASVHISGPASFERVLQRFGAACGLDAEGVERFRALVHEELGFHPDLLEAEALTKHLSHPALLIHDEDDKEVPFEESSRLHTHMHASELRRVQGLGHRRIVQDKDVIRSVTGFLKQKLQ